MRGADLLARGTALLAQAGVPDPGRDARRLLAHVLKVPPGRLTLFLPEPVDPDLTVIYNAMIERRADRVPVSHLTGRRMFYGREFLVTRDVLDPRPETETLVEAALAAPFANLLDLGTGTGCLLLTLLMERPEAWGVGTDISRAALDAAFWNRNAMRLESRAALEKGDWFDPLDDLGQRFDLIVSNPPYISATEMETLAPEVRDHEPRLALTDEGDGLDAYRRICAHAPRHLARGGRLMVEIGPSQGAAVTALMAAAALQQIRVIPDLDGRDRVVVGVQSAT